MDEKTFDNLLRSKLGEFEDPVYDKGAFEQFQQNFSNIDNATFFQKYRTEITVISALILFSLLNAWITFGEKSTFKSTSNANFVVYQKRIDSLQTIITELNSISLKENISENTTEVKLIDEETTVEQQSSNAESNTFAELLNKDAILLASARTFTFDEISSFKKTGHMFVDDGNLYFTKNQNATNARVEMSINPQDSFVIGGFKFTDSLSTTANKDTDRNTRNLSPKTVNALERHYFPGVGINIAPRVGALFNQFEEGPGFFTPTVGVGVDLIVSPKLSIEAAFDYGTTRFQLAGNLDDYGIPTEPYYSFGSPDEVNITSNNLSVPVSLKYRSYATPKTQFILRGTVTPYYTFNQKYVYTFKDEDGGGYGGDAFPTITKTVDKNVGSWTVTTVGLSAGFQTMSNKKYRFETSLFAEQGLSPMKPQEINMRLFGLRAAYWFRIK